MKINKIKHIAKNKKAYHDYHITETFEAGIVLKGFEVKSIRMSKVNFIDSFCEIREGEIFIRGLHISPYKNATHDEIDPRRLRKLLLHKKEIKKIETKKNERGLTCIPLSIYLNEKNKVKLEIGLAKGKKKYDKRESIKKKDMKRQDAALQKYRNVKL
jgi:SsrA-binding protein